MDSQTNHSIPTTYLSQMDSNEPDGVFKPSGLEWNIKTSLPYNPKLRDRARELRKQGILSEVVLWQQVKTKQLLGLDFTRQQIIGHYIVDFFCNRLRLVIEIDGSSHDNKEGYDKVRDEYLQSFGLVVVHYTDIDVLNNLEGVLQNQKIIISRQDVAVLIPRQSTTATPLEIPRQLRCHPFGKGE